LFWKINVKLRETSVNTINIRIVLRSDTAETPCLRDDVRHSNEWRESK